MSPYVPEGCPPEDGGGWAISTLESLEEDFGGDGDPDLEEEAA